ncbi:MAG: flavodoxin [Bacteroidota bacterium]|nr:flavodoxin [Bacteroidota bacterium]
MRTRSILFGILVAFVSMISIHAQTSVSKKKILVAYFSHSGNTRFVANQIKNATGGDIFEIQSVKPYPQDYQTVVDQAKREINSNYKPALKTKISNIRQYDVIFIGSPNWWSTIAPPVATFLSSYNLEGKTIVPFMTHEGTRMGHSVLDIKKLCPKSTVLEGLSIRGGDVGRSRSDVEKWLRKLELEK